MTRESRMRCVQLVLALLLCSGCPQPSGDSVRPEDAPDFVVLSVSGHHLAWGTPECDGVSYNCEYLWERGTVTAIGNVFTQHGYGWEAWTYVDELYSYYDDTDGDGELGPNENPAYGFLSFLADIDWLIENWISDFVNPTQVVVVAHSHGGVWAHSALMLKPELPVDVLLDLDTNALCWEDDLACLFNGDRWQSAIDDYVREVNPGWSFDVGNAGDSWSIPGLSAPQDIEDLVPDSVSLNIEVHSNNPIAYDNQVNHRLDGTQTGVYWWPFDESHSEVTEPGSQAMQWAIDVIESTYAWP